MSYEEIEKGMCLVESSKTPSPTYSFKAKIFVLNHPTMIKRGYEAVAHMQAIKQTVKFRKLSKEPLRTGDSAVVILELVYKPIYIPVGERIVLREGRTRAIGVVEETYQKPPR